MWQKCLGMSLNGFKYETIEITARAFLSLDITAVVSVLNKE